MDDQKTVETPGYEGPERRGSAGRRAADSIKNLLPAMSVIIGLVIIFVAWGVSYGTAKAQLADKVNIVDQLTTDARQDSERADLRRRIDAGEETSKQILIKLDSANNRLRQIVCDGKAESCR